MHLLSVLGADVLQITLLHAVTVRENELSLGSPDRVTGSPGMTSPGNRTRETAVLMLRV